MKLRSVEKLEVRELWSHPCLPDFKASSRFTVDPTEKNARTFLDQ